MPRERIAGVDDLFDVNVGWQDEHVQVSVGLATSRSEKSLLHAMFDNEAREKIGKLVAEGRLLDGQADDYRAIADELFDQMYRVMDSPWRAVYATINRSQINRMIRVLRRARDSAYGEDA